MGAAGMETFLSTALTPVPTIPSAHAPPTPSTPTSSSRCAVHTTDIDGPRCRQLHFWQQPRVVLDHRPQPRGSFIQREIVARTGLFDCRTHPRTWPILRETQMPTALIDVGYVTNPDDASWLDDPAHRDIVAEAISSR